MEAKQDSPHPAIELDESEAPRATPAQDTPGQNSAEAPPDEMSGAATEAEPPGVDYALSTAEPQPPADDVLSAAEPQPSADDASSAAEQPPSADDALSPAVRRLVRQYDLDVTGIHGTGPSGRIRVGDVIALLGARTESTSRNETLENDLSGELAPPALGSRREPQAGAGSAVAEARLEVGAGLASAARTVPRPPARPAPLDAATPTPARSNKLPASVMSTVFECDLGRVLAHRRQARDEHPEPTLASYYLVACAEALKAVAEVATPERALSDARIVALWLTGAEGESKALVIDVAEESPLGSVSDRVHALDRRLRAAGAATPADVEASSVFVHHYGASGSLLATPLPLGAGHAASIGIGRVRRQLVVRNTEGEEAPRLAAVCYLSLTFDAGRVTLARANRFMTQFVRVLEHWHD